MLLMRCTLLLGAVATAAAHGAVTNQGCYKRKGPGGPSGRLGLTTP